jgi:hypothetical protein
LASDPPNVCSTMIVFTISMCRRRIGSVGWSRSASSILPKIVAWQLRYQASGSRSVRTILASGLSAASRSQMKVEGQSTVEAKPSSIGRQSVVSPSASASHMASCSGRSTTSIMW